MSIAKMEGRPPYVMFEVRPREDREATKKLGSPQFVEDNWVIVTPQGSKDRHEKLADEWFEQKERDVQEGRFPADWFRAYRAEYEAWKSGQETPVNGTPLKNWTGVSKGQLQTLLGLGLRTVEDLAAANVETMNRVGMGATSLKQLAQAFLDEAAGPGTLIRRVGALQDENAELKAQLKRLEERISLQAVMKREGVETQQSVAQAKRETVGISSLDLLTP